MNFIKGYKQLNYSDLKSELSKQMEASGKTLPEMAVDVDVSSTSTIRLVFDSLDQKVSDKVLTSVCQSLNFNAFVIWMNGERFYFIKSKN